MSSLDLERMFRADQAERNPLPAYGTPEYVALRERDAERRDRVVGLFEAGMLIEPEDLYRASMILTHGDSVEDVSRAHELARRAAEIGHRPARWLAAAALDRSLLYRGKPQRFGTSIVPDGERHRLWDVDPRTTDEERAEWDVPPLSEMVRRAGETTSIEPLPPMEDAPAWLREALERWSMTVRPLAAGEEADCEAVLRSLPEWFGIEESNARYAKDIATMETLVALRDDRIVGFVTLNRRLPEAAEVHVMAVLREHHREGIGRRLVRSAESRLRQDGVRFLQVKTLSPSHPDPHYARTRAFYLGLDFTPLEDGKTLWGEANPCLQMVKRL